MGAEDNRRQRTREGWETQLKSYLYTPTLTPTHTPMGLVGPTHVRHWVLVVRDEFDEPFLLFSVLSLLDPPTTFPRPSLPVPILSSSFLLGTLSRPHWFRDKGGAKLSPTRTEVPGRDKFLSCD